MDSRCPRKLKSVPSEPCPEGLAAVKSIRNGDNPHLGCPFFVADPASSYCFFKWNQDNGGSPISDAKIAQLLLISDSEVKKILANFRKRAEIFADLKDD